MFFNIIYRGYYIFSSLQNLSYHTSFENSDSCKLPYLKLHSHLMWGSGFCFRKGFFKEYHP